jgi:Arc/MetJ-type ribon-helix-helix transcriptional regulator
MQVHLVVVREGVQRAEYLSASDRNRAALQAQLLQQGFGQAQQLAQQNMVNK